jgi:hypothetical protein
MRRQLVRSLYIYSKCSLTFAGTAAGLSADAINAARDDIKHATTDRQADPQ